MLFRRVSLNNIKFYFKISWIKMGNVEDRMNIDEANDDYCKSLGFITLKIEKFSEFAREGKDACRLSDPIYIRGFQWRILAKPMESRRRDAVGNRKSLKSLSYFLQCSSDSENDSLSFSAKAKLKLLARKEGKEDYVQEIEHYSWRILRGVDQFMGYEELMDSKNGWYDESTDSIILRAEINANVPIGIIGQSQMCENLLDNLFNKRDKYYDCTLVSSDGIKFKAHKCILASQSPVFAAMFEHGMVEAQNGIVNIEDIQSNILEKMIRYMYTGQLNIENIAEDLLIAAEKYELVNLKLICQRNLVDSLNNENACRLLVLAGQNSSKFLKVNAIEYIKENGYEVRQTEGWKMLLKGNYGDLVDQIFKAVLPKKN